VETVEEAAERESRDARLTADKRAAIAFGEKLQLKLKVSLSISPPLYLSFLEGYKLTMMTFVNSLISRILFYHSTT
jgi:hypothetical protein